jgi:cell division protein FtsL
MLKLLLCVITAAILAALVLQLRQQRQELGYQNSRLHDQIKDQQSKLWNQQLQIAVYTAPNAITKTVDTHDLKMVPQSPLPRGRTHWIDVDTQVPAPQPRR